MIYNYRGYKYSIDDKNVRVFDTRGVEVGKMDAWNMSNHLHAQVFIDAKLNKKPNITIGLYETEPYSWDVYYKGKVYLGCVKQKKPSVYQCFSGEYDCNVVKSISELMDYFRFVAKQKGL